MKLLARTLMLAGAFLLAGAPCAAPSGANRQAEEALRLRQDFAEPPRRYWPRPLWFWNDTVVTAETVKDQMRLARDRCRYGGFGILPFGKNFSPAYLSDGYFAVYGAALEQAKALGLTLSLYDEYGFPSGSAGAQNSSETSLFAQRWPQLTIKRLDKHEWAVVGPSRFQTNLPPGTLAAVVAMNTNTFERVDLTDTVREGRLDWPAPAGAWKTMAFVCVKDGDPICDYLDPEAADRFIELTHQAYYDRFAIHFGTTIDSTFFDEPTLYRASGRTWTDKFNEKFQHRHGFSPRPYYPALWHDIGPETQAARNYLFGFRTELYATGFPKRIEDWCAAHGIRATGHQDQEEVVNPVSVSGDLMKCFQYLDIPGIDKIGGDRPAERFYKLVSSAAYNWDKSLVMSETYGAMGDLSWDALYAVAMEQYTKGINLLIPHAVWYDDRNVTFKPELSWRQPLYAERLPEFNTYLARLNLLLQNDDAQVADLAVLYPIATLQGSHHLDGPLGFYQGGVSVPEADYVQVGELLSAEVGRDYVFLHPEVLERKCVLQADELVLPNRVHPGRFTVLILPGHKTIHWSSLRKVQAFYSQGGSVIATGQLPFKSAEFGHDADVVKAVETLFGPAQPGTAGAPGFDVRRHPRGGCAIRLRRLNGEVLREALEAARPHYDVTFEAGRALRYIHKRREGRHVFFFANLNPQLAETLVTLRGRYALETWDPHSGKTQTLEVTHSNRWGTTFTHLRLALPHLKSAFLVTAPGSAGPARRAAPGAVPDPAPAVGRQVARKWTLPDTREVQLRGPLGRAYDRGAARLAEDPYRSAAFLRSDFSFETNRVFVNYSGDISGRFIEVASLMSPLGRMRPAALNEVLRDVGRYQKPDGHFGREVNWNEPLEPENPNARLLPIFWGNSRLLVGLLEAHRAFGRADLLATAKRLGDFYLATADRFLDPAREGEYRSTGSYAAGYVTDYFPGIEGLARLYQVTQDQRYLRQAERMARFFQRFDTLPIDHSHGHLITHHALLLLYEITGQAEYLERPRRRWQEAVAGGYVWPPGGVGEKFRISYQTDEGCSEADWLRLNLRLWKLTGETRFLDMAERLLWNHYAMNRTANGGYGHHNFLCDPAGPLLMKPEFTEAVWCCTFHGLLGLHTLKSYLVTVSDQGVFVNFPFAARTAFPAEMGLGPVTVSCEEQPGALTCLVRLESSGQSRRSPGVFLRRPSWAERVAVSTPRGLNLEAPTEDGCLRLPTQLVAEEGVRVTFAFSPRVENRRLTPVSLRAEAASRLRGITLWDGPRLLLANTARPQPVVAALVGKDGRLQLPRGAGGGYRLVVVSSVDATEPAIAEAARNGAHLRLSPWEEAQQDAPAAFVFDLIALPETSAAAESLGR
jgi:DUF1680 family protein